MGIDNFFSGVARGIQPGWQMGRQIKEDDWIEEQRGQQRAEWAEKAAIKDAARNTLGQEGTTTYDPNEVAQGLRLSPEQRQMYDRDLADFGPEGARAFVDSASTPVGLSAPKGSAYTREQAMADYTRRLQGINPDKAIEFAGKAEGLTAARNQNSLFPLQRELLGEQKTGAVLQNRNTQATLDDRDAYRAFSQGMPMVEAALKNKDLAAAGQIGADIINAKKDGNVAKFLGVENGKIAFELTSGTGKPTVQYLDEAAFKKFLPKLERYMTAKEAATVGIEKDKLAANVTHWGALEQNDRLKVQAAQESAAAMREFRQAQVKEMEAKSKTLEARMPDGDKMLVKSYFSTAEKLMESGNAEGAARERFKALERMQVYDDTIDPYKLTGIPSPGDFAERIKTAKPKEQERLITEAGRSMGMPYAAKIRSALNTGNPDLGAPRQEPAATTTGVLREGGGMEEVPLGTIKSFGTGGLYGRGGVYGPR